MKATLADTADIYGNEDKHGELDLNGLSLTVNTDKALRSLYAGERKDKAVSEVQ